MADFILEIGTEELPARFLAAEERDIVNLFEKALADVSLDHGEITALATPRRLVLRIKNLADRQPLKDELIVGPPAKVAFDADGKPTRALIGFAKGHNLPLESIGVVKTEKGEYAAASSQSGGADASDLLAAICPDIIAALPFPKSMKWGENDIAYARPIRWIMALLDDAVIPFNAGPVRSGREICGHRIHGPGPYSVSSAADYSAILDRDCAVIVSPDRRRELIIGQGDKLAAEKGGRIIWKESLLDEVQGLVEHPLPILGSFDPAYLEIPPEVLLTSMETHQKSFGVKGADGALLPCFLTVLNLSPLDVDLVRHGWERVLKARLEDAHFFWRADLKQSPEDWLKKLDNVIFIGALGNMGEKSRRLEKLCGWLAERIAPELKTVAERAGLLAKTDLVSGMVGEFDVLQGIMGGIYAEKAGEDKRVAQAIKEQYLPSGPDSPLPESLAGAILAIADKADTLAGCFGLDMIPTGAADPNGLRRCALGIIRITLDRCININIAELFRKTRDLYGQKKWRLEPQDALQKLLAFFEGRLRNYFIGEGCDTSLVDAVLAAGFTTVPDFKARLDALAAFAQKPEFAAASQTLKRVENIARKAAAETTSPTWDKAALVEPAEKNLALALEKILPVLKAQSATGNYDAALAQLAGLREPVDKFFDNVLVLCEDEAARKNRLGMLKAISDAFGGIAQFSLLHV